MGDEVDISVCRLGGTELLTSFFSTMTPHHHKSYQRQPESLLPLPAKTNEQGNQSLARKNETRL